MESVAHSTLNNKSTSRRRVRQRETKTDHMSRLTIDLLIRIFCLLPIKSWLIMSTVSKQYEHLWTHIPFLNFDEQKMVGNIMRNTICPVYGINHNGYLPKVGETCCAEAARMKFIRLVDRILRLHSGSMMNSFFLSINYYQHNGDVSMVDDWAGFALTRNIKEVSLKFDQRDPLNYFTSNGLRVRQTKRFSLYTLPCQSFSSKALTTLTLGACQFKQSSLGTFESLRFLYLNNVDMLDNTGRHFLSKFPVLETLSMEDCVFEYWFFVIEQVLTIKFLHLIKCVTSTWAVFPIDITAPNLSTLYFRGTYLDGYTIRGASNLKSVYIDIEYTIADQLQGNILHSFLKGLSNCQCLELTSWCIQVLSTTQYNSREYLLKLQQTTKLRLWMFMIKQELPGLCCLLRSSPILTTLTIESRMETGLESVTTWWDFVPNVFEFQEDNYWESQDMPFACLQNSVKIISIVGFTGRDIELQILKFLLQNAMVLETLELDVDNIHENVDKNVEEVMNFERASRDACVVIHK